RRAECAGRLHHARGWGRGVGARPRRATGRSRPARRAHGRGRRAGGVRGPDHGRRRRALLGERPARHARLAPRAAGGAVSVLVPTSPAFLRLQAVRRGGAGGLYFGGRAISYGELTEATGGLRGRVPRRGRGGGGPVGR